MLIFILILFFIYFILYLYEKLDFVNIYIALFSVLVFSSIIYIIRNPTELLIPYNFLIEKLYEKKVFYSEEEKRKIFPTSKLLEEEYTKIKAECLQVLNEISNSEIENVGKNFIVPKDENFFKNWNTYPLRMFSKDYEENMDKCPTLSRILKQDTNITTAFFSIMEPGKFLSSHYGPFKGILRYHLGLQVPPPESGLCYISVDGETYEWKEGEGILFDETYKHFVENSMKFRRIVLFLDVKRELNFPLNFFNDFILFLMSISPYNF
jgi:aspartyl/asparaginyl beta-hydroxylase (cupin superfamily)